MSIRTILSGLALGVCLGAASLASVGPAAAQDIQIGGPGGVRVGPGGIQVAPGDRDRDRGDQTLTRGEAIRIARRNGLVDVDDVDRRGPRFVVRGSDRRGDDMTVVVDSRSGEVVDVRRR